MTRAIRRAAEFVAIEVAGRVLYYCGVLFLIGWLRRRVGRPRVLVPMYHRVRPAGESADALLDAERGIEADRFEQHLRVLSWFGRLTSLDAAFAHVHSGRGPRTLIAVTFDDGYRDNLEHALPALLRRRAAATVFPVVRTTERGRPLWWDELTDVLRRGEINGEGLARYVADLAELAPRGDGDAARVGPTASRATTADFLCGRLVRLPMKRREQLLDRLAERLRVLRPPSAEHRLYLDWAGLRDLTAAGLEIGGHTLDHPALTAEPSSVIDEQVAGCRRVLESRLGRAVTSFAYPNGEVSDAARAAVVRAGFRLAVTTRHGVNYRDTDPLQLRRVPLGRERPFHLAFKLAFYGWVHRD